MSEPIIVDLFAEDRGHEEILKPLIRRIAQEEDTIVQLTIRSARGGHGRVLAELKLYQSLVTGKGGNWELPELLVVATDSNCRSFSETVKEINGVLIEPLKSRAVFACPDPHVELWYLSDSASFHRVVGITPALKLGKCERDYYKSVLATAIRDAGEVPTLGGLEYASELVSAMDLYAAGKVDNAFSHFVTNFRNALKLARQ